MTMDPDNPVIKLCAQGMAAEARGETDEAARLFQRAWEAATDDYESCVAAHYVARHQPTPEKTLCWNQESLTRADRVGDERVTGFYASLHFAVGRAHAELDDAVEARRHFELAARRLSDVSPGEYADQLRRSIDERLGTADPGHQAG